MAIRANSEKKLLDAADELFFSRGIAATPVDDVLRRAGVSAATLYRGFDSKEELLAAVLERRHREWLQVWDEKIAAQDTAEGRVLAVFDALEAFRSRPAGSRWCAFLGAAAEYADAPAEVEQAVRRDTASLRNRLSDLASEVSVRDGPRLAEELLLLVTGDLAMRLRSPAAPPSTARRIAALLLSRAGS